MGKTPDDIRKKQQEFAKSFGRNVAIVVMGFCIFTVFLGGVTQGNGQWHSLDYYRTRLPIFVLGLVVSTVIYLATRRTKTPTSQPALQSNSSSRIRRTVTVYVISVFVSFLLVGAFTLKSDIKTHLLSSILLAIPITLIWILLLNLSKNKQARIGLFFRHLRSIVFLVVLIFGLIHLVIPVMITTKVPIFNIWLALFSSFMSVCAIFTFIVPNIMLDLNQYDAAIQHVNLWLRIRPTSAVLYIKRGFLNLNKHDYEAAIEDGKQAINVASDNAAVIADVALLFGYSGQYEVAIAYLEKVLQTNPPPLPNVEIVLHTRKADIYLRLGDYDNANVSCKEALKIEVPSYVQSTVFFDTYNKWGITFLLMGDYERALNEFEKAQVLIATSYAPLYGLAATHYKLGNWEKAAELWQHLKQHDNPDFELLRTSPMEVPAYIEILEAIDKRYLSSSNNEH